MSLMFGDALPIIKNALKKGKMEQHERACSSDDVKPLSRCFLCEYVVVKALL